MAATDCTYSLRELAHREMDGIEVVLFWDDLTNNLTVCVSDDRSGSYFELEPEPHCALDVFYHPYAHAAHQGIPYDDELLASWASAAATSLPFATAPTQ